MPKFNFYDEKATPVGTDELLVTDSEDGGKTKRVFLPVAAATIPDASTTVKGKVALATDLEHVTGTEALKAATPAGLTARLAAPGEIGGTTPAPKISATILDTAVAAAGVTLAGTTLAADGTDAAIDISITPKGTGSVVMPKVAISGGEIAGTNITEKFTSSNDPAIDAAVTTAIVDANNGVLITLTVAGNAQTLQTPTAATVKKFTVINNDTSTDSIVVNGITLTAGKGQTFLWDGTAWGPVSIGITAVPVPVTEGGSGRNTGSTAYGLLAAGVTAAGVQQTLPAGATTEVMVGGGASALPVWTTATGTGAPVRATSPTLVTPILGAASATALSFAAATELTIAAGVVTVTQSVHKIDTAADGATDDLDTISGGSNEQLLLLRAENAARTVVVKNNTGNILLGGDDVELDDTNKYLLLVYDSGLSKWLIAGGSGSGALTTKDVTTPAFKLALASDSDSTILDADRTLTFDVNNADRTLDMQGDVALEQDLLVSSSPTFTPAMSQGPAIVSAGFAGTVSSAANVVTFTEAADAILAGYRATNPILGTTIIASAQTRIITGWNSSTECTVDSDPSPVWAALTAITSVQGPMFVVKTSAGVLAGYFTADGTLYLAGDLSLPGYMEALAGSGAVVIWDQAVGSLADNAEISGSIRLGATTVLKIYGQSDGAGGVKNLSVKFPYAALPNASDGAALGSAVLMWSDLFLASGAVININNGNVTLTHSAGQLALVGNLAITGNLSASGAHFRGHTDAGAADYNPSALTADFSITANNTAAARAIIISTEDVASGTPTLRRIMEITDEYGNAGTVGRELTISLESGGTINGAATAVIASNYDSLTLSIDGTNAYIR